MSFVMLLSTTLPTYTFTDAFTTAVVRLTVSKQELYPWNSRIPMGFSGSTSPEI